MSKCKISILFLFFIVFSLQAQAQSENPNSHCQILERPDHKIIRADAREINQDYKSGFKAQDGVQIILENMNPFLFEYKVTINAVRVQEPAFKYILKIFGLEEITVAAEAEVGLTDQERKNLSKVESMTESVKNCLNAVIEFWDCKFYSKLNEANTQYSSLKEEIDDMNKSIKKHQAPLLSETAKCEELVEAAQKLKGELENNFVTIKKQAKSFNSARNDVVGSLNEYLNELKNISKKFVEEAKKDENVKNACTGNDEEIKKILNQLIQAYEKKAEKYKENISELNRGHEEIKTYILKYENNINDIEKILENPENFTKSYTIGPYGAPTDVKVKIERKNLKDEEAKIESLMTAKLNFGGGPRFALAAGVGFSFLDKRDYRKAWGFELDRNGNPVEPRNDTAVVSKGEDSNSRSFLLLMLHTRVLNVFKLGTVHISLGVTGETEDDKVVEYIGGLSLGLAEERLFMTLGFHYGKLQKLDKQVYIGAPVPEEVDDIPVTSKWKWAVAFSLTYRIK